MTSDDKSDVSLSASEAAATSNVTIPPRVSPGKNAGWGPSGVQGRAPGQGSEVSLELKTFQLWTHNGSSKGCLILCILQTVESSSKRDRPRCPLIFSENSPDLHQSPEQSLVKVKWTCSPQSSPRQRPWYCQCCTTTNLAARRLVFANNWQQKKKNE